MPVIEKATLSDQAVRVLRADIVSGALPAGAPLRQGELSARLGISMGSMREALRTLHSEGLVTMQPNRGALVSDLSAAEAGEIFDIRAMLELGALELALPLATARELDEAEAILAEMDATRDASRWAGLNRGFHDIIYRPAGRPRLLGLIAGLHDNVGRYMRLYLDSLNFQAESQKEHRALLAAAREGDSARAAAILRGHLLEAREKLVKYLIERDAR